MMTTMTRLIPATLILISFAACNDASKDAPSEQTKKTDSTVVQVRGRSMASTLSVTVQAIDVDKRLITLKSPDGGVGEYSVGPEVKRLAEIKVGDTIRGEYVVDVVAELREPTEAEKKDPLVLAKGVGRAPSDAPPTGLLVRGFRVVSTVDAVDATASTFTLKGPLGNRLTVNLLDKSLMPELRIGRTIIVTFSEALALTVDAAPKK
jgi:hypothetical protein